MDYLILTDILSLIKKEKRKEDDQIQTFEVDGCDAKNLKSFSFT